MKFNHFHIGGGQNSNKGWRKKKERMRANCFQMWGWGRGVESLHYGCSLRTMNLEISTSQLPAFSSTLFQYLYELLVLPVRIAKKNATAGWLHKSPTLKEESLTPIRQHFS